MQRSLTKLDTIIAEVVARQDHLTQAKARAKGRKEGNGSDGKKINEEDCEQRIDEA